MFLGLSSTFFFRKWENYCENEKKRIHKALISIQKPGLLISERLQNSKITKRFIVSQNLKKVQKKSIRKRKQNFLCMKVKIISCYSCEVSSSWGYNRSFVVKRCLLLISIAIHRKLAMQVSKEVDQKFLLMNWQNVF